MRKIGFAAISTLMLSGCLIAGSSEEKRSGHYVSDETFSQIKPGNTSASWVKATLGDPDHKSAVDDGSEVWKYTYTIKKENNGAVFLIFGGHNEKEFTESAFIEFRNGVVVKTWRG
jgi:outer membrane protein assembly factor BamE (lipoprotein component of BamABCDE complex)